MTIFLVFILTISIVVGIHEFGHYQMARWCNVKVLKFSIGFGRPLFTFLFGKDQTAFVISSIPLGGYVKLLDESQADEKENFKKSDLKRAFNRQPLFKRFLIVAAGPLINIILGVCIFCFIFMHGSSQIKPLINVSSKIGRTNGVILLCGIPLLETTRKTKLGLFISKMGHTVSWPVKSQGGEIANNCWAPRNSK